MSYANIFFKYSVVYYSFCLDLIADENNFHYRNRKDLNNPNEYFQSVIATENQKHLLLDRYILVLDFNTNDPNLENRNIVRRDLPDSIKRRSYTSLTSDEKSQLLFLPYFKLITSDPTSRIIHIDHHYDIPILNQTSTTVLIYDFVMWLHSNQKSISRKEADVVLKALEQGYAIRDHSDADITLAHVIARNATNYRLLNKIGPYIKAAAIFNDHLAHDIASRREQSLARVLFAVCVGIEKAISEGLNYESGLAVLLRAAEMVAELSPLLTSIKSFDTYFLEIPARLQIIDKEIRGFLASGLSRTIQVSRALQPLIESAIDSQRHNTFEHTKGLIPEGIHKRGRTLVINLVGTDLKTNISSSDAHLAISSAAPELLTGIDLVVAYLPEGRKNNIKFRSVNPSISLEPLYEHLRLLDNSFKGAGGRATAGAISKSGLDPDLCAGAFSPLDYVLGGIETIYGK